MACETRGLALLPGSTGTQGVTGVWEKGSGEKQVENRQGKRGPGHKVFVGSAEEFEHHPKNCVTVLKDLK